LFLPSYEGSNVVVAVGSMSPELRTDSNRANNIDSLK
jgi:hypothetical protein